MVEPRSQALLDEVLALAPLETAILAGATRQ
jgi:hypothetical protein